MQGEQQSFETGVVVDHVETPAGHGGVDPGQIGRLAGALVRPTQIVAPGGIRQHGHSRL